MDSFNRLSNLYLETLHTCWKLKHQSICCGNRVMSPWNSCLLSSATLHIIMWINITMLTEILYSLIINDFQCIETNKKTWLLTICKIAGKQGIFYDTHQAICAWGLSQHISSITIHTWEGIKPNDLWLLTCLDLTLCHSVSGSEVSKECNAFILKGSRGPQRRHSMFLQKLRNHSPRNRMSYPRRPESSETTMQKP
jgi:hypothetical protein